MAADNSAGNSGNAGKTISPDAQQFIFSEGHVRARHEGHSTLISPISRTSGTAPVIAARRKRGPLSKGDDVLRQERVV